MEEDVKIYKHQIENRISLIVKKLKMNKHASEEEEKMLTNILHKVLLNEHEKADKYKLLDLIDKVNFYNDIEISKFINNIVESIINKYDDSPYVIMKQKIDGSNNSIVCNLAKYGYFTEENIINYKEKLNEEGKLIRELESKDIKENRIIMVIDDYVGSGKSIINILKEIEKIYKKQNIIIIAYIWQLNAIAKVEEYINESQKENNYNIYNQNIIKENTYSDKYADNFSMLDYITKTCNTCKNEKFKFGYNNTGAMITINGLSPNNNISMLWRNDLRNEEGWIAPFSRDINILLLQKKKEKIIKESYEKMKIYYNSFYHKSKISFDEFKMLLLLFNSYYIKLEQIKDLLGLDTCEETEKIIEKFRQYDIIIYEVDNIIEFVDEKVIEQFKKINQHISRDALEEFKKKSTNKF